ncbi:MAG: beta-glucuronidase [Pseudomonadales bacterium]|nr:beta-glucuronidase [Pseudomonadales bacterium]
MTRANIQNPYNRKHESLDGDWHYLIDPYETGFYDMFGEENAFGFFRNLMPEDHWASEYNFKASPTLKVPGDWNSQEPTLMWYEGTLWYFHELPDPVEENQRTFLRFGGANYDTIVWVNAKEVARHTGGFTPFEAEVTDLLQPSGNFVVAKVNDTRLRDGVPTLNTDWWNYGGITREVLLVHTPQLFIRDYFCQLDADDPACISGFVELDGGDSEVRLEIPELGIDQTLATSNGRATFSIPAAPERWSPENPRRYDVAFSIGGDRIEDRIGFRTIETRGEDILLNGEPVFLRGISIHEEAISENARRAYSEEDARRLLTEAKELGCNFARLAHYPHNDHMSRVADELGLMLWCEIPVYWAINWASAEVLENARTQLSEMIIRDRNRASIVLWSIANETPVSDARTRFLKSLVDTAKSLDPTRLTTAAMFMRPDKVEEDGKILRTYRLDDPLAEHLDVMGCNQYLGWYYTRVTDIANSRWYSDMNKPLIMSEFGAGAPKGKRGGPNDRWTEDYQVTVYEAQLSMMEDITFLRGLSPWVLKDFRTPKRPLAGVQDYFNRKGVISDKGERKLIWDTLTRFYEKKASEDGS